VTATVSAIVPTIGRPVSLAALLDALCAQTRRPDEVIIADGSGSQEVADVSANPRWLAAGLRVRRVVVQPPNAVRQRQAAIALATGSLFLLLDDDVVPEPECVAALVACMETSGAVAVSADFSNQDWPPPTTLWRCYLRWRHGIADQAWQGRVIGPLLRFGYHPVPDGPARMEWIGSGNSLVRRDAYERAGGFSDFFLHRSTTNEDVDLGLKLARQGSLLLCPAARMAHMHASGGRAAISVLAEDDLYNRYCILARTLGRPHINAVLSVSTYFTLETVSAIALSLRTLRANGIAARLSGRIKALIRIATSPGGDRLS
jgi:GT2 family glycosyltransferase